jgi:membrane protein required for beta-lactamase induction
MTETLESMRAERDCARAQLQATQTALRNTEAWLVPTTRTPTVPGHYLVWQFSYWAMVEVLPSSSSSSPMLNAWVDGVCYHLPTQILHLWAGPVPSPPDPAEMT